MNKIVRRTMIECLCDKWVKLEWERFMGNDVEVLHIIIDRSLQIAFQPYTAETMYTIRNEKREQG